MKNAHVVISSFLVCYVPMVLFQLKSLLFMASSRIYDVITLVLMTSYDSIQVDMIPLTPFYDPAKFISNGAFLSLIDQFPDPGSFSTAVYRVTIQSDVILVEGGTYNHYLMISAQYGTSLEEIYSHHNGLFTLSPPSVLEMVVYYLHISKLEAVIVDLCRQVLPGCFMGSDYYHILKMTS